MNKYIVCISSDTPLNESLLEKFALSQDIIFVEKIYSQVESAISFEEAWQNGSDAIAEREAYYHDLNKVFMGFIEIFQRQGMITEDGKFDYEGYTTASIVHFSTKMASLGIKLVNDKADKINAEVKDAKERLRFMKNKDGLWLTQDEAEHYQGIIAENQVPPFKIDSLTLMSIQLVLKGLNSAFPNKGRELNFNFETMGQNMQPLGDIMAKWCVKAATGSEVAINFLKEAGLLSEEDLAKMTAKDE